MKTLLLTLPWADRACRLRMAASRSSLALSSSSSLHHRWIGRTGWLLLWPDRKERKNYRGVKTLPTSVLKEGKGPPRAKAPGSGTRKEMKSNGEEGDEHCLIPDLEGEQWHKFSQQCCIDMSMGNLWPIQGHAASLSLLASPPTWSVPCYVNRLVLKVIITIIQDAGQVLLIFAIGSWH